MRVASVNDFSCSSAGGARHFSTHRHQFRRTGYSSDSLPFTLAARGKTHGLWCVGAVGGFSLRHGRSVALPNGVIYLNKDGVFQ